MAYNNNGGGPRIQNDRFGNPYQLKTAMEVINKKDGNVVNDHYSCYVELGGKLYKIEVSPRQKETKTGGNAVWVKVTAKPKRTNQRGSM